MKPTKLIPMLWTADLQATIDFYTEILGFTCGNKSDEWGWAALHIGEVELMLSVPNEHVTFNAPQFTGSFYFKVDDVDELYARLKDKEILLVYPIEDFEWQMREFAIYDNNGYMLQFGQELTSSF